MELTFQCPQCGGSWYGTLTSGLRQCHDEYGVGCQWAGPDTAVSYIVRMPEATYLAVRETLERIAAYHDPQIEAVMIGAPESDDEDMMRRMAWLAANALTQLEDPMYNFSGKPDGLGQLYCQDCGKGNVARLSEPCHFCGGKLHI